MIKQAVILASIFVLPMLSFSQTIIFKSHPTNELILDIKDSTYTYNEVYNPKQGEDLGYSYHSKGFFTMRKDTLTLLTEMPENDVLAGHIHKSSPTELDANKFSYIYPIQEKVAPGYVKIYFDNIAEPGTYQVFEVTRTRLNPLPIKAFKRLEKDSTVHTEKDDIRLFHYIELKKPSTNKLLIMAIEDHKRSESYFLDLEKVPFQSFHFYTRAYSNYYDFTGLKFLMTQEGLKRINQTGDSRYQHGLLNAPFEPFVKKYDR